VAPRAEVVADSAERSQETLGCRSFLGSRAREFLRLWGFAHDRKFLVDEGLDGASLCGPLLN